jgi:hypothetical protein
VGAEAASADLVEMTRVLQEVTETEEVAKATEAAAATPAREAGAVNVVVSRVRTLTRQLRPRRRSTESSRLFEQIAFS